MQLDSLFSECQILHSSLFNYKSVAIYPTNNAMKKAPSHRSISYFVNENSHRRIIEKPIIEKSVIVIP